MTDLTPEQLALVNPGYWATLNNIKIQSGPFSFKNHEYQIEPMSGNIRRKCYMKSAQTFGATEIELLTDIWGMITKRYPSGVAHIFPTADEVGDFAKSRINPLIKSNKLTIGKYVKDTDTASIKKVRDAFLYLRSGRQSGKIGNSDENTSSKTAGFTVDRVVFDEVDFMDEDVIEKYKGRMAHSLVKEEVYLGNPSHEDFGIDSIFKQSDQRHWFRKCSCGHWTCAEESFPQCIKIRKDGTGYIGCDKCGKELPIWNGTSEWVAKYPDKTSYMQGYLLSQLSTIYNDPAEILEDYTNPPHGNLADIYRLRLSMPYSARDEKLTRSDVLQCCGGSAMATKHNGPCAMGVDVGKIKHVVIGIKTAKDRYEIVHIAKCETFQQIMDLAKKFNVKSSVVDIRPYEDEARAFQKESGHKTFLCEYSDTAMVESSFNDNTGIVKVHRTGILDATHKLFTEGRVVIPRQSPIIEEFTMQCCNTAKFEEKDKRRGTIMFRYRPTGNKQDHFRHATCYALVAAQPTRVAKVSNNIKRSFVANNRG